MLALYIIASTIGYVIGGEITTAIWMHEDKYAPAAAVFIMWPVMVPIGLFILSCTKGPYMLRRCSKKQGILGSITRLIAYPYTKTNDLLNPPKKPQELPKATAKEI